MVCDKLHFRFWVDIHGVYSIENMMVTKTNIELYIMHGSNWVCLYREKTCCNRSINVENSIAPQSIEYRFNCTILPTINNMLSNFRAMNFRWVNVTQLLYPMWMLSECAPHTKTFSVKCPILAINSFELHFWSWTLVENIHMTNVFSIFYFNRRVYIIFAYYMSETFFCRHLSLTIIDLKRIFSCPNMLLPHCYRIFSVAAFNLSQVKNSTGSNVMNLSTANFH